MAGPGELTNPCCDSVQMSYGGKTLAVALGSITPVSPRNPVQAAFAISLNIEPELLRRIAKGDARVEELSGRSSPRRRSRSPSPPPQMPRKGEEDKQQV